ncbi:MAG: DUF1800 domain-containing protein [Chitinophagia bacterium]|nr:DUF1800 domain-containing protein [Chitinophagia bacterium]
MSRRKFFSQILPTQPIADEMLPPPPSGGLNPYSGAWTTEQVVHLLKRTQFGAKWEDVQYFASRSFQQTITELLNPTLAAPDPPVKDYVPGTNVLKPDTNIAPGTTWVNDIAVDGALYGSRVLSFQKWWIGNMVNQDRSIREKMILFWHNHFATEADTISNPIYIYRHHQILRNNALGNFKALTRAITLDPGMLVYLNGQYNTLTAPDENYGRELQELFCCGKGPDSKYTEDDVKAAARVLTGWRINTTTATSYFDITRHDKNAKQFSSFYNNTTITGRTTAAAGEQELDDLLNMIFATNEVSKYICRRLYRWFIYYDIDASVEANIITPLANIFVKNNYEILPVLEALLKSEHFFNSLAMGCQIKSPIDLVIGLCREFSITFPLASDYATNYGHFNYLFNWASNLQQRIADPPDVSGWKAYYQEPIFYEVWINSDTLPRRIQFSDTMILTGYTLNGFQIIINATEWAKKFTQPADPNQLINEVTRRLLRIDISAASKQQLKRDILLGGQYDDKYWTDAWNLFLSTPGNTSNTNTVKNRLRDLIKYIMNLPEYQLS